jgi:diguanylate cyclase (GGDEF)-like protein
MSAAAPARTGRGHDHAVEFYETEAYLVHTVVSFAAGALHAGEAVLIVATADHRRGFATALRREGVDLEAATGEGLYLALDAATVLHSFVVDGSPDPARFAEAVRPLLDTAAVDGRRVNVFGEMVALLYAQSDVASALKLEDMWNDLAVDRPFKLLCAYPMSFFEDDAGAAAFRHICSRHSEVIPAESFPSSGDPAQEHRAVAELQQANAALRADVTRLRGEQQVLAELAYVDALTGLANRRAFDIHLQREWSLASRDRVDSFVLMADLDGFKAYNDLHGHGAGDEVLRGFAEVLQAAGRCTDVVARLGGDEFAVLLVRCEEPAAEAYGDRLRELMIEPAYVDLNEVTASVGHASLMGAGSAAQALHRADLAMFDDKRGGRR